MRSVICGSLLIASIGFTTPSSAQIRIAILGDSVASGEGNPDVAVPAVRWGGRTGRPSNSSDQPCHRGATSGFLQAAERLGADLSAATGQPVVIETFACTGATTAGVRTSQLPRLRDDPQFLDAAGGGPTADRIDAIIMSVGANNAGFGTIAVTCALSLGECHRGIVTPTIESLPGAYRALNDTIRAELGSRVANVFIVEYYDPSIGPDGPCGATTATEAGRALVRAPNFADLPFFWGISYFESRWASETFLPALNAAVGAGARAHGWHYVGGAAARFRGHGHCASRNERWVRNLNDSLTLQGDAMGVLHPNRAGHDVLRDIIRAALGPFLDTLAPPEIRFITADYLPNARLQGGQGPSRQVVFQRTSARRGAQHPRPPGFPNDGPRQRVGFRSGEPILETTDGSNAWKFHEIAANADTVRAPSGDHWVAATRTCNTVRCSAWSTPVVTPPAKPRVWFERSGDALGARLTISPRNGVYQVAFATGTKTWDIYEVDAADADNVLLESLDSRTPWSEAPPPPSLPSRWRRRRAGTQTATVPFRVTSFFPQTREVHARGCNETGCSEWDSAADFVNALRTPVPGEFAVVMSPRPCRTEGGRVICPSADQGVRTSAWEPVPGTDVYQIIAYRTDGSSETWLSEEPLARMKIPDHLGFRVRACNVAQCSSWSSARMFDPGRQAPPPPGPTAVPESTSKAAVSGTPPRDYPNPTF